MANSVMMFDVLGYPPDHPQRAIARRRSTSCWSCRTTRPICQPCVSPVWDTGLTCHALLEVGGERAIAQARKGLDWLMPMQILDVKGDWVEQRPDRAARRLGVPIRQSALSRCRRHRRRRHGDGPRRRRRKARRDYREPIARAREWIVGMQSKNGGWGAFDADNEYDYLNNIPFADHGALLDPPTEDVTARCLSMLAQLGETAGNATRRSRAPSTICARTQLADGSWYGRWGMNYIYGTWSVLCALNAAGVDHDGAGIPQGGGLARRPSRTPTAAGARTARATSSTIAATSARRARASQTAWALLGLMAAGEVDHPAVARGIDYLSRDARRPTASGTSRATPPTGFPRVFYLRYHGYAKFFPLWALARYRNLKNANSTSVAFGM